VSFIRTNFASIQASVADQTQTNAPEAAPKDMLGTVTTTGITMEPAEDAALDTNHGRPEFTMKYQPAGEHPITGYKLYDAILFADRQLVYIAGPKSSKVDLKEELDLKIAEIELDRAATKASNSEISNAGESEIDSNSELDVNNVHDLGINLAEDPSLYKTDAYPEFTVKYQSAGEHPITGEKLYNAILFVDREPVYKAGPKGSKVELNDEIEHRIAQIELDWVAAEDSNSEIFNTENTPGEVNDSNSELEIGNLNDLGIDFSEGNTRELLGNFLEDALEDFFSDYFDDLEIDWESKELLVDGEVIYSGSNGTGESSAADVAGADTTSYQGSQHNVESLARLEDSDNAYYG